jgi:hypothetical protein
MNDYARRMPPDNQAPPGESGVDPPLPMPPAREYSAVALPSFEPPGPPACPPGTPRWPAEKGLFWWLVGLLVFGLGGLLIGQQELAALVAVAGLFVAAQAADLDGRWTSLYYMLSWVVPVASVITFISIVRLLWQGELGGVAKWTLLVISGASAIACAATVLRPVSDPLTRRLLHAEPLTHAARLGARLVFAGLLLAVPGWFALRDVLADNMEQIVDQLPLGGGLVGYVLLALAAVGFLVRRDLRATLDRLGLKPLRLMHLAVIGLGVGALLLLNNGADWVQMHAFPELWKRDREFNESLAGSLTHVQAILLGLSAGIGEEITMRGALQPRLGLILTSALFAALHIQYSWFGMLVIFVLGAILGIIRQRTSTTVAMAVHGIYDILAVFTT